MNLAHAVTPGLAPSRRVRACRKLARAGESFERVALPYAEELYAHGLRLTRSPEDARDLVQETYVRALAAWPRFQPGTNCRAWLYRILTNSFINIYRRRRRRSRHAGLDDDIATALYGAGAQPATACDMLSDGELSDEVAAALDDLGDIYREIIVLADIEGLRYRDIAARLGLPLGTVMSRLHRARQKLRAALCTFAQKEYGFALAA